MRQKVDGQDLDCFIGSARVVFVTVRINRSIGDESFRVEGSVVVTGKGGNFGVGQMVPVMAVNIENGGMNKT